MNFKNIITATFIIAIALTTTVVTTPVAEASCSYNGYYNSKGKCEKSYENKFEKKEYKFQSRDASIRAMIARLEAMIAFLESQLSDEDSDTTLAVSTITSTNINDDSATLRGKVYLNDEDEAEVYFIYGTSRTTLDDKSDSETYNDDNSSVAFEIDINDLNDGTTYYYQAVAEDNDGDKTYGSIYFFKTDSNDDSLDLPVATTKQVEKIATSSAEIHGLVDMNDFSNGLVFFAYGEEENLVKDVEDDYTEYADVDEDGDNLQKVEVDSDLDGDDSYNLDIENLNDDTNIYYSICVEFENEDNDQEITCGSTKSFSTNNN